ncbi:MAG: dephospho-CoA kinase [Gammaproteobacteria bacterium]|nr:dephospho-CoA kinase [Gammaproteobacteria bacterium]
MLKIGLTGGIGSGKSLVAHCLRELGVPVIDLDHLAHSLTQKNGLAILPIAETFGEEYIVDGSLDRAKMRQWVFADSKARQKLEAILHPLIQQMLERQLAELQGEARVVLEIPLLVESRVWRRKLDKIWVVDCLEATQIDRVQVRSHLERRQIEQIMQQQAKRLDKLAAADLVIYNQGKTLDALQSEVRWALDLLDKTLDPAVLPFSPDW